MFKGSIAIRLGIWFLILAIFPLAILAIFVLDNVADGFDAITLDHQRKQTQSLASILSYANPDEADAIIRANHLDQSSQLYVVDLAGRYLFHPDDTRAGTSIRDDFSPQLVEQMISGAAGSVMEKTKGQVVGFAPIPGQQRILIVVNDNSLSRELMASIRVSSQGQLGAGLLIVAFVGGVAIWIVVGKPVREFTRAAQQIGQGNLKVRIDPEDSVDELHTLAITFNEMTAKLEYTLADLRREYERAENYLDTVETIIVALDREGHILTINRKACQVLERPENELLGKSWFLECLPQPDGVEIVYPRYKALILEEAPLSYFENPIRAASGELRIIAWRNALLYDDDGRITGSLSAGEDITERRKAEEALRALTDQLEQRVTERTAELEAANKELESFSYSVSHDLRSPLRSVHGYAAILEEDFAEILPAEARTHLKKIQVAGIKMGQLIDALLIFSRIGRSHLDKQPLNLNDLTGSVIESLATEIGDRQIEWRINDLHAVQADPILFRQVFANLLENAVKYTRGRNPAKIEIGCSAQNGEQVYYVRDNGAGFDMKYADKLFGVFQRLHHEKEFEGTGIGLANVHRIIVRHGGRVWAEAEPDKGATFYFTIQD